MSAYQHPELRALDQIEDLLEAYAGARLAPAGPALRRMRGAVMAEAKVFARGVTTERRRLERAAAGPRVAFGLPRPSMRSLARPAFALGFAGLLALGTGTAITTASPGSVLFGARVALEDIFLPVQIDARFASHEQHLDERLAEAQAAAADGDGDALAVALTAYQDEIDETYADVGDDFDRLDHFESVLEKHVATLTELSGRLPVSDAPGNGGDHARAASATAVTKTRETVAKVKEKKGHADVRPATPPSHAGQGGDAGEGHGRNGGWSGWWNRWSNGWWNRDRNGNGGGSGGGHRPGGGGYGGVSQETDR